MNLQPSLDTWTTIFLVVVLHGMVLSVLFFFREKGRKLPNVLLGAFLLLFSVNLIAYVAYWTRYNLMFPHIMGLSASFQFLYGPLIYLYAKSVVRPYGKWKKWELLHFVPFLIFFLWISPMYFQSASQKLVQIEYAIQTQLQLSSASRIIVGLKSLHMLVYAGILFNLENLQKPLRIDFKRILPEKTMWISVVKYCFSGFAVSYMLFFILVDTIGYGLEYDYVISFAMAIFIFTIGYTGLSKPEFLYEAHNGFKYENSSLEEKQGERYLEQLLLYMEEEKPFINGDLKLEDLAEQLHIPRHHLSQIINERLGKNYFEFINSYRISEAKKILSDPGREDYIILRVAFESGFNNKTTFNSAFKNEVGTTPSEYRKKKLNGKISVKKSKEL